MSDPQPTPPTEPDESATPPSGERSGPPQWLNELRDMIERLPERLDVTLTEADRTSIAEHVHQLFERSGAFATESESPAIEPEADEVPPPPSKRAGLSGFAARFLGEA